MNTGETANTLLRDGVPDVDEEYLPPKSKQICLDDGCNNNLNVTSNDDSKWACPGDTSLVEPEILKDMGVCMLEDEEVSRESVKKLRSEERVVSPSDSKNSGQYENFDNMNLDKRKQDFRDSDFDGELLDRLKHDTFEMEDSAAYASMRNEPGCSTLGKMENYHDGMHRYKSEESAFDGKKSGADQWFLYRRKKRPSLIGEDIINKLSDEMILSIFKWLPKKCLVRSMLVCKRWCQIARDEALWSRLDLGGKVLAENTLGHILPRGVQILRLAQAEIADPVFKTCADIPCDDSIYHSIVDVLTDDYVSKLQYLDLSMAVISTDSLAKLLSHCRYLKKLSLEKCTLNQSCCKAIRQNVDLSVLNLTMCEGIDVQGVREIIRLTRLYSLNMAWCSLNSTAVELLCEKLPSSIIRFNIAGCRKTLTDDDVKKLVNAYPDIVELDLSDCSLLTVASVQSLLTLTKLEHLSLSRCYSVPPSGFLRLSHMPSLLYLDVFGVITEQMLASFRTNCGGMEFNKFLFSSIARPTVGVRRTSIWGLRVRD